MTELTRRTLLAGAAVAGAAAHTFAPLTSARAAAPTAGKQVPGIYRYKVGAIEVTAVTDGMRDAPLGQLVRNAPADQVNAALQAAYLPKDKSPFIFTPVVVNTGSKLVMIDTGLGPATFAQSNGTAGQAHSNMAAAGIDRGAIDMVIISHFHGDHINGLLNADGTPAFPNAEITVPETEWAFWTDESKLTNDALKGNGANVKRVFGPLAAKLTKYGDKKELVPGITAMATPGHTPGHHSHVISSGSESAVVQADVSNHPALFVRNPGWHAAFDMDAAVAEATRRKLYDQLAADKMRMQGFHFPFPATGYIEKDGAGYRYTAAPWNPLI
jgi:glyoxylase-like metal-dependent hydrolase (beta-lactamase superfamily II)